MKKIIVASTHEEAGKTSLIIGMIKVLAEKQKKSGYMKPLGDRLLYRKKRLWDYDSALVTNIFGLEDNRRSPIQINCLPGERKDLAEAHSSVKGEGNDFP